MTHAVHQIHAGVQETRDLAVQFVFQRQSEYFRAYPNETVYFCPSHSAFRSDVTHLENAVKQWTTVDKLLDVFCKNPPSTWIRILTEDLKLSTDTTKSVLKDMVSFQFPFGTIKEARTTIVYYPVDFILLFPKMTIFPAESPWSSDPRWAKLVVPFDWISFAHSVETLNIFFRDPPTDFFPDFKWPAWKPIFRTFGEVLPLMISLR